MTGEMLAQSIIKTIKKPASKIWRWNCHRTTDVYIITYPKSGTLWLRFLLGRYMQSYCNSKRMPLFDYYDYFGNCERACIGPSINVTHGRLQWSIGDPQKPEDVTCESVVKPFYGKKVVFVVRHPLDAITSAWFQRKFMVNKFQGDLHEYIDDEVLGLPKCIRYLNVWAEGSTSIEKFLMLRYEDIKKDPKGSLEGLLSFLNIPLDMNKMDEAVAFASFDNMQRIEKSGIPVVYRSSGKSVFGKSNPQDANTFHVREGKKQGYAEILTPERISKYLKMIDQELDPVYQYMR